MNLVLAVGANYQSLSNSCQSQLSPAWDLVHSEPEDGQPSSLKIEEEEREQTDDNERDSSEHEEVGGGETNDGP